MMRSLVRTLSTTLWLMVLALAPAHAQGLAKFGIGTGAGNVAGSGQVGAVVVTPQVRAELLAHAPQGIAPGQPLQLGLQITHQPEWHTYWKNPGDSGLPTTMDWTLPAGLKAGEIVWPTPKKIPIGTLANYGYEGTVLLPVPVTIGADFKPASERIDIALRAAWLVCRKECIPEEGEFRITLPVRGSTAVHGAALLPVHAPHRAICPARRRPPTRCACRASCGCSMAPSKCRWRSCRWPGAARR
ncbi:MAG: protein-disulfide reductase DsbD domain-containing protein [Burkholderiaceae bacterium]